MDLEKPLDSVPRKVLEWAMRKNRIPEVLNTSVMSLYDGEKTRVRVVSELSEECEVKVEMHHGSVLSPLLFAVVVDVVTELAREGVLIVLLNDDDMMNDSINGL